MNININERNLFWDKLKEELEGSGIDITVDKKSEGMNCLYAKVNNKNIDNDKVEIIIDLNSRDEFYKDSYNNCIPALWIKFKGENSKEDRDNYYLEFRQTYPNLIIVKDEFAKDYKKVMIRRGDKRYSLEIEEEVLMTLDVLVKLLRCLN